MTGETTARLEERLAVILISLLLRGNFAIETILPKVRRYGFQIVSAFFTVFSETPERRHLRARTKCLRIFQPNRYPLPAQLQAHVFEIRPDLLLILLQITRLYV